VRSACRRFDEKPTDSGLSTACQCFPGTIGSGWGSVIGAVQSAARQAAHIIRLAEAACVSPTVENRRRFLVAQAFSLHHAGQP
jgi:hypothetical protein